MSLKDLLSEIVDDVAAMALPVAARLAGKSRRVAVAKGEALEIYEVAGERVRLIASPAPSRAGKTAARSYGELRLPVGAVQTHDLALPAATLGYVEPVLDHRLEKLTPWAPDRVLYGYKVAGETGDGSISVRFAATARDIADAWATRAEAAGFTPTAIGGAGGSLGEPIEIDLWRGTRDVLKNRVRRTVVVAALVALLAPLPPLAASIWMLGEAQDRVASVEARSAAARRALAASVGGGGPETALIARKRPESALLTIIDRIALTLPDGTVLRELEIGPETIRIAGASQQAPALLGLLSASDAVGDARFSAPVTRNADGRDGFEIVADRKPAPTSGPASP